MSIVQPGPREPMLGDPDDHRPASMWRLIVDPERNPAPGTESDPPQRVCYDLRTGGFEVLD